MIWFGRFPWRYIGSVEGYSHPTNEQGERIGESVYTGIWVLSERGNGERKAKLVGDPGNSQFAMRQRAAVVAWLAGGPVPAQNETPRDPPKKKAKLISFPGGKTDDDGDAA